MSEQTVSIRAAQELARSVGFDHYTDDPAWIRAASINRNELDTFAVNGDGDPEDRGTYPRPLAAVLTAYHEGEADGMWTRVAAYLAGMTFRISGRSPRMNVPGFSSENPATPPTPFCENPNRDENSRQRDRVALAIGRAVLDRYSEELEGPADVEADLCFGINGADLVDVVCSAFERVSGSDAERRVELGPVWDLVDQGVVEKIGDRYFYVGGGGPLGAAALRGQCGLCRQPLGDEERVQGFGGIAHKRCVDAVGGASQNGS